ncbi:ABC transporter substrate-binding protein [Halarcobacter anaerophilus]|uniref:ABC transporter substrate-binding protein n=1 Tax=Halarcobacter anaerophilus TaxID=877500 RepID=UPI0005CAED66|nr:ABC transporter substrate-binding protein [Halarcobacter anaerophilus]
MKKFLKVGLVTSLLITTLFAQDSIKIGFVGTLSGANAAWGTSNVRSMETSADIYNAKGGVEIAGKKYKVEIVPFDDAFDPKIAVAGMEKMAQEGIKYVVGPNDDAQAIAVKPIAEKNKIVYFPYAFDKSLYVKPANYAIFGMIASYQWEPSVYKWLKENKGVKTVAFIAANAADPLNQRDNGIKIAEDLGLKILEAKATYKADTRDFYSVITPIIKKKPDLLVLSGVSPATAPLIIKTARELGFKGYMAAGTALDASILKEGAGDAANGFICQGGADASIQSKKMEKWVEYYTKKYGEYNDESNTKVFALEYILAVLKSNPKAINNADEFLKTVDSNWSAPNLFFKDKDAKLKFVGKTTFGQNRQLGVPLTPKVYENGEFKTLFVGSAD